MSLTLSQIVAAFDANPFLKEEVRNYLANEQGNLSSAPMAEPRFLITITRGTPPSVAARVASKCPVAKEETVNLYWNTVEELGFPKGATWAQIHAHLTGHGSQLCEPDDGPQLWRQNLEEFPRGWLWMAIKGTTGADGRLLGFGVHCSDDPRVDTAYGPPGGFLDSDYRVVFSR